MRYGSIYLVVKDFNKSLDFYEKLLDMKVIPSFKGRLARWSVQNLIPFNEWK